MAELKIGNVMTQHRYRSLRRWSAIERKQTQIGEVQHRLQQALSSVDKLNAEVRWWREWWFGHDRPEHHEKPANESKIAYNANPENHEELETRALREYGKHREARVRCEARAP